MDVCATLLLLLLLLPVVVSNLVSSLTDGKILRIKLVVLEGTACIEFV